MPTRESKSRFAVIAADKDAVCSAKQAASLLDDLRRQYRRLTPAERTQMKTFISDLADSGLIVRDKQVTISTVFPMRRTC